MLNNKGKKIGLKKCRVFLMKNFDPRIQNGVKTRTTAEKNDHQFILVTNLIYLTLIYLELNGHCKMSPWLSLMALQEIETPTSLTMSHEN